MKYAALVGLALFAAPALADKGDKLYRDAETKFAITVPAGWTTEKPAESTPAVQPQTRLYVKGPVTKEICLISTSNFPQTAYLSQRRIEDVFVRSGLLRDHYMKMRSLGLPLSFDIVSDEITDVNGHLAQITVWKDNSKVKGPYPKQWLETASIPVPGRIYEIMCDAAGPIDIDAATPTLRRVLRSLVVLQ